MDLYAADGRTRLRTEDIPLVRAARGEFVADAVLTVRHGDDRLVYLRCNASPLCDSDSSCSRTPCPTTPTDRSR